ncbi:hypothetical protein [Pseudozobellia thermophila]|uniref:Uncharacterized protein n=1 Tax=Pseudozobellia thermophila TaxID=192903 RepID=A0A1M6APR3_9FLAO|nr:hypothetical protein [Pseudozobellia thermophila]SHI38421.1 hypothetical protein SAMN04488513_101138 [Pseudozobellia thermophila]
MKYRFGSYVVYKEMDCYLISRKEWRIVSKDIKSQKLGFKAYEAGFPYYKKIDKTDIQSGYFVRTKAKYKDFTFELFQNEALKNDYKVRLKLNNLDFDAYDYFGFPYRNDDASIEVNEEELEEIWEERKPLARFPFKTEKIKFIKKEGEFL